MILTDDTKWWLKLKEKRVDGFGILKGSPPFSREDKGDGDF